VKRQLQELDVEHVHITFNNVHYVSTLLYDVHGHYLQVTVEGQLPIGHLYGLASRSTGDALAHQQEMEHRVVCDLLGGARTPTDGAVVIAPHLTVGIVQHTPKFNMDSTLLENVLYGTSGRVHVPETTVWHLLKALGLPRYLCNSEGGATPMGAIALSQQEQQLLSLARTLICEPDVLIVHNLGYFRSSFSARVGSVLKMYTDGYPYADWGSNPPLADHRLMLKPMGAHIGTGSRSCQEANGLIRAILVGTGGTTRPLRCCGTLRTPSSRVRQTAA
jgi:hypothetical protein